jgi:hypothetical protein
MQAEICNGENHVRMVSQLSNIAEPFREFYEQLQFAEKWSQQELEGAINQTQGLLDAFKDE